jgi:hypothetical protein
MGSAPPGEGCERHRLCAALQLAMVLLLQGPRTTHFTTRLCGFYANGAAPAGLLLRTRQRGIYARSQRCHCTASKKLFHARHRNTHRPRATGIASALTRYGGRSAATPKKGPPIPRGAPARRSSPLQLPCAVSLLMLLCIRADDRSAAPRLRIMRERTLPNGLNGLHSNASDSALSDSTERRAE